MQISIFMPETDCFPTWIKRKIPKSFFRPGYRRSRIFVNICFFYQWPNILPFYCHGQTTYKSILCLIFVDSKSWGNFFMSRKLEFQSRTSNVSSNVSRFPVLLNLIGRKKWTAAYIFEFELEFLLFLRGQSWTAILFLNSKNTSFIRKDRDFRQGMGF